MKPAIILLAATAASPLASESDDYWRGSDHGREVIIPGNNADVAPPGILLGTKLALSNNEARQMAQQTLKVIAEKRPDLIASGRADNSLRNSSFSGRGASASVTATLEQARNTEASKPAFFAPKQSSPASVDCSLITIDSTARHPK